ncbi:MAG: methylmalonyl Co-A mutase-associated GTPase MeaB [Thermoplasmata archaeon]|nr:MAG: methylmalonyl Co-A mutase-associated GTPase MeaB [Thermoplasmata archaeon]
MNEIVAKVLKGDARSIARLITLAENNDPDVMSAMKDIHPHTGNAYVIGITGVMGSGKSTLIYELTREYRQQGLKVGIIAIDPTSPFSGGALLGDRVRMMELATDDGVFIRSMGTRGMLGGLTSAVYDVVEILDASGKDIVMVETVGIGQAEVDVIKIADTTLVVLVPGLGDSIQTIKAGVMEIADIFVVNKADRSGVEQTIAEIESYIDIANTDRDRKTPVLSTIAKESKGISELIYEIDKHREYLKKTKRFDAQRRKRYEAELVEIIRKRLMDFIFDEPKFTGKVESLIDQMSKKEVDPYTAADEILGKILK